MRRSHDKASEVSTAIPHSKLGRIAMLAMIVSSVIASIFFVLLLGAVTPVAAAQEKTKVTKLLATGVQIGHLREYVAKGAGFYEAEGLDVTLQPAPGSATQIQYMIAGKGSFGSIDMHMAVELPKKGNARLVSPYAHFQSGVYRIGTLEASPIKRVGDFKGKRVGVPTTASGAYTFLLAAARQEGVREADMQIIPVTFGPAAVEALLRGRIDGVATTNTAFNTLRYLGMQSPDWKLREIVVPMNAWPTNSIMVTEDEIKNQRGTVIRALRAFSKSQIFIETNLEAAVEIARRLYPELVRDEDKPRQLQLLRWAIADSWTSERSRGKPLGWFDLERWAGTEKYYKDEGLIGPDDSVRSVINTSLLDEINHFDKEQVRQMARNWKK
jgi:NitT/TauT family transport system substrate-binding protein